MIARDVDAVRGDFVRFYAAALRQGLRRIRWNIGGCIVCNEPHGGILPQRMQPRHGDETA